MFIYLVTININPLDGHTNRCSTFFYHAFANYEDADEFVSEILGQFHNSPTDYVNYTIRELKLNTGKNDSDSE